MPAFANIFATMPPLRRKVAGGPASTTLPRSKVGKAFRSLGLARLGPFCGTSVFCTLNGEDVFEVVTAIIGLKASELCATRLCNAPRPVGPIAGQHSHASCPGDRTERKPKPDSPVTSNLQIKAQTPKP